MGSSSEGCLKFVEKRREMTKWRVGRKSRERVVEGELRGEIREEGRRRIEGGIWEG